MAQFDYNSVLNRLVNSLRGKNSWAQVLQTSTGESILGVFAEEVQRLAHYNEYLLRESKWSLAQNKSSLTSQSYINGYVASRPKGSTGTLKVSASETFDSPPTNTISIPINTIFTNGELNFINLEPYSITPSDDFILIDVIQATPLDSQFTASGDNFEEFYISSEQIENDHFTLKVNGQPWNSIIDIREADLEEEVYQIVNEYNYTGITIRFGNKVNGKRLSPGDVITFDYYETEGALGNITGTNVVNQITSQIFDSASTSVDLFVTNEDLIIGGANIEDIESIRAKAPNVGQTFNSATTIPSYIAIIESIGFIHNAIVWGAVETNIDNNVPYSTFIPSEENRIYISAYTDSGDQLTQTQKDQVIENLLDKKAPTDIPEFIDVEFIKIKFTVDAFSDIKTLPLSQTKANILAGISEEYDVLNREFKSPIYESDYKRFIDEIEGVGHHNTSVELVEEEVFNSAYVADYDLRLPTIKKESIRVYIRDNSAPSPSFILVGTDNGSGAYVSESGYDLTGSAVDYATGAGTLTLVSGLTGDYNNFEIKFEYQLDSTNLVPTNRNQVLIYSDSIISVQYES